MNLREDFWRAVYPWVSHPADQCRKHLTAAKRSVLPVEGNNDFQKALAAGLFAIWATVTLAQAFDYGSLDAIWYGIMTAVIYTIIGLQWGFELHNMPIAVDVTREDTDDE